MERVLLIDDDRAVNYFNNLIITKHAVFKHVEVKQSGATGLEFLQRASEGLEMIPDVIFLDINMPAMNGWEFLDRFEKMDSEFRNQIKVIILSSSSNVDHVNKTMKNYDVVDYINKPLSIGVLNDVFKNHNKATISTCNSAAQDSL